MGSRLDSDALMAIRRLRRHLTVWRLLAVIGFTLAVLLLIGERNGFGGLNSDDHVARVSVDGVILADPEMIDLLDQIAEDPTAKALIVDITSPGGTFDGGEAMYGALRRVANKKPVVAVMGGIATSGAYMTAIGADRIFASYGTITASIGVIMQSADVTDLLDKVGIKPETIKSGALKATPNPAEKLLPDARQQLQEVVNELHMRFAQMVADRRGMSLDAVLQRTGDGRIMTGARALEANLIDEIGGYTDARAWLATAREVSADLPVLDWQLDDPLHWWRDGVQSALSSIFGISLWTERLRLDGVLALWQPSDGSGR